MYHKGTQTAQKLKISHIESSGRLLKARITRRGFTEKAGREEVSEEAGGHHIRSLGLF